MKRLDDLVLGTRSIMSIRDILLFQRYMLQERHSHTAAKQAKQAKQVKPAGQGMPAIRFFRKTNRKRHRFQPKKSEDDDIMSTKTQDWIMSVIWFCCVFYLLYAFLRVLSDACEVDMD